MREKKVIISLCVDFILVFHFIIFNRVSNSKVKTHSVKYLYNEMMMTMHSYSSLYAVSDCSSLFYSFHFLFVINIREGILTVNNYPQCVMNPTVVPLPTNILPTFIFMQQAIERKQKKLFFLTSLEASQRENKQPKKNSKMEAR